MSESHWDFAEGSGETSDLPCEAPKRLAIVRDPERERDAANEEDVTAVGVQMPSGCIHIQWRREAFDESQRTNGPTESRYESIEDAKTASGGEVVFIDP